METVEYLRTLPLTGCGNFRDIGGYETADGRKTRWRLVFRSDSLHQLTHEDLEALETEGIALTTGFDLRTHVEIETSGIGPLYERGTRHLHTPFVPDVSDGSRDYSELAGGLGELYGQMFPKADACVATFFHTLAETDSYPLVFYCSAGKDRTGMTTALLLRTLGVSDEQIAADYHLTETLTFDRLTERLRLADRQFPEHILRAQPETILGFLSAIDAEFGSVEDYLDSRGVTNETLERVREHLLEA